MSKRNVGLFVLAVLVIGALVPAMFAPSLAEAEGTAGNLWMVYTPNHPKGCAPLPYDCFVIWVWPEMP
jgi:hypothetical protein